MGAFAVKCKLVRKTSSALRISAADIACVQTARNRRVRRSFDDCPAVGKQGHLVGLMPEFEDKLIVPHRAMRPQTSRHLGEVDRTLLFMNLDGISAAERDVRPPLSRQVDEVSLPACVASRSWPDGANFGALVIPDIP